MIPDELLWLWRNKLDELTATIPEYNGSMAQKFNETSYSILEYNAVREHQESQEPQTIINISGGYRIQ